MSLDQTVNEDDDVQDVDSQEPQVFTVSQLNKAIRQSLEGQYALIWLRGEISNFKSHSSGHFYFCLKDEGAQINAVMFRGFNNRLKFKPGDGMEVLVKGKVTVYEPRGTYQIFCEYMEPVGAGALQIAYEQLKAKLQAEGLFDPARKRKLPTLPRHIAIVTSPTGAAIRDMLTVLGRRFKGLRITLIPAVVQGDQAPPSIIKGIVLANRLADVDVLIVGRGGGSIEDLWAFNDEGVARAIVASRVPVISAVGHEVDFTIADFVADLRAPTPSAAAELVVRNAADIIERIRLQQRRLTQSMVRRLQEARKHLDLTSRRLVDPKRRLQDLSLRCDELSQRLEASVRRWLETLRTRVSLQRRKMKSPVEVMARLNQRKQVVGLKLTTAMKQALEKRQARLGQSAAVLDSLSPLKVVDRGYSIARRGREVVRSVSQFKAGDELNVRFSDGSAQVRVLNVSHGQNEVSDGL